MIRLNMSRRSLVRSSLLSTCAAVIGGAGLLTFAAARAPEPDTFATTAATGVPFSHSAFGFDAPICHSSKAIASAAGTIRLAQTPEVPPAGLPAVKPAPAFADSDPPLWDGLGSITYPITTANAQAQSYFNQGLRLTYAFNHDEARRAFRKAQRLDPDCAMCFWGEALVLGPNINLPMQEEAVAPAYAALGKAQALAAKADAARTGADRGVGDTLRRGREGRPCCRSTPPTPPPWARSRRSSPRITRSRCSTPRSLMDLSPWDYWKPGGAEPNPQSVNIVPTLERVLAQDPNHIGAIHFYIHAVEASDRPQRAEPYADRMRGAVPGAGHLVHMPSHIFYRVGRYLDALADNKAAAAVDEKYLAETNAPMGVYRLGYYPHNVHFTMASAQMSGDGATVIGAAEKLRAIIPDEVARGIAMVHPVKAAPYFAHAQFSSPETILALPDPGDVIPYVKAMWHYARGVAYAARRDVAAATAEADAIAAHRAHGGFQPADRIGDSRAGRAEARAHVDRGARRAGAGRHRHGDRALHRSGRAAGRAALHGAAVLVLPGAPVARRSAAAGRPARRG